MQILIKANAGNTYNEYGKKLAALRGQWVEVETAHVFNDQYNTGAPYNLRVMDADVEAVRDDIRAGLCECGYCGFQGTEEEVLRHFEEEESRANSCAGCFWHRAHIVNHTTTSEKSDETADGYTETKTTVYKWARACEYDDGKGCIHNAHRAHGLKRFTPANTYFLRYPNGYAAYFAALPTAEAWREFGYIWNEEAHTATRAGAVGSYDAIIEYTDGGSLSAFTLKNSRAAFTITGAELREFIAGRGYYAVRFWRGYTDTQPTPTKRPAELFAGFPAGQEKKLEAFFDELRDRYRHAAYIQKLIDYKEA